MSALTETDLKETFGVRVKHPIGFINYRAYEVCIQGIERQIKVEVFPHNREKLFKIRRQIKQILREL